MVSRIAVGVFIAGLLAIAALAMVGDAVLRHDRDAREEVAAQDAIGFEEPSATVDAARPVGDDVVAGPDGEPLDDAVLPVGVELVVEDTVVADLTMTLTVEIEFGQSHKLAPDCYRIDWGDGTSDEVPCVVGECFRPIFTSDPVAELDLFHEYGEPGTREIRLELPTAEPCELSTATTLVTVF